VAGATGIGYRPMQILRHEAEEVAHARRVLEHLAAVEAKAPGDVPDAVDDRAARVVRVLDGARGRFVLLGRQQLV
jgi:hypothetical protein